MVKRLTIIKLGGSVVTNKLKPLTFNYNSVDNIAKIIKNFDGPVMIVHGAGSFGHYYAKYYGVSDKPTRSIKSVIKINCSLFERRIVIGSHLIKISLYKSHAFTIFNINRRKNDH